MSFASAINTAHTAMAAAQFAFGVLANNMANAQTDGFKASRPVFNSSAVRTSSAGSAPGGASGGSNPLQVGLGVEIVGMQTNFQQGPLVQSGAPLDLAIEGPGFFMVDGPGGEPVFTRNAHFGLNAAGEIVSATGNRLLGHPADTSYQVDRSRIAPLTIPQGMSPPARIQVDADGTIRGSFADGTTRNLGQVTVARFPNPSGLVAGANNVFSEGSNSGLPTAAAGSTIVSGARELSNASVDQGLLDLDVYSAMFRVNARVVEAASRMFDEMLNLRRR